MMTASDMVGFRPVHEANAIETVVVTIQFKNVLDDLQLVEAFQVVDSFEERLKGKNEMRGMGIQVGPQGVTQLNPFANTLPDGISRFRTDARGVQVEELRVDRQSIAYVTQNYVSWDIFWENASSLIFKLIDSIVRTSSADNIAAYSLTYVDRFIWEGSLDKFNAKFLLQENSPYVTAFVAESDNLWHCHSGKFIRENEYIKRLSVIRLDCVDEQTVGPSYKVEQKRYVRLENSLTDHFHQPGFSARNTKAENVIEEVSERYQSLHSKQREMLASILNSEILRRIGM